MKKKGWIGALVLAMSLISAGSAWAGSWDGNTYIDDGMDYKITLPETYEDVSSEEAGLGSGEDQELRMGLPDGTAVILVCLYDAPQIAKDNISAEQWAMTMQEAWECDGEVKEVTYNDCTFSKITLPKKSRPRNKNVDLYFRRTGDTIMMLETIYVSAAKEEIDGILGTIETAQ